MITNANLARLLGDQYDRAARYCMVEAHTSGRGGAMPFKRRGEVGNWTLLGEFSDPEVASARSFRIYRWDPQPEPKPEPISTKEPAA